MKYDAFISYSQKADGQLAGHLQRVLSRLGKPWYQPRGLRIFRDKTTLSATPHLWPAIAGALDDADYFILMASPDAAESRWVQQEIAHWLNPTAPAQTVAPADRILIVLTDGAIVWSDEEQDFDWRRTNALPPGLRKVFKSEPLYVDLTWARSAKESAAQDPRLLDSVAKLAGAIRGVKPDEIVGEDVRQHRNMKRSAATAVGVVLLMMIAAGFLWWQGREIRLKQQLQDTAERVLPARAGEIDRIRHKAIREIEIELDPHALTSHERTILELRLELDPLFTQPMSIFFAPFREGDTWPDGFKFSEPPYTEFGIGQYRIDAKFLWFGRIEDVTQAIDGTDVRDSSAHFNLSFDGQGFTPRGPGIHLAQTFEIPPLQKLVDDRDHFRLVAHYPASKTAKEVDLKTTDINLTVTARFREEGNFDCVLFASQHTAEERAILDGDYLRNKHPIEAEALLHRYPAIRERARELHEKKTRAAWDLFESGKVASEQDRRTVARLTYQRASLAAVRGQTVDALNGYIKVLGLLEPLVSARRMEYEDGELLYVASRQPVSYFLGHQNYKRASDYVRNPITIAERLLDADPAEPNYQRWWAEAMLDFARVSAGRGESIVAAQSLKASIEEFRNVQRQHQNAASAKDLHESLTQGIEYAARWGVSGAVPVAEWRKALLEPE
jgi:TIR domain-containing protein